jgi:hypothetical protein
MYVDEELYRVYWKTVHNRAGEYLYTAMCGYHFSKSDDGEFTAVTPGVVLGVNDKTNRACLAGRSSTHFIERAFPADYFSVRTLTHLSD